MPNTSNYVHKKVIHKILASTNPNKPTECEDISSLLSTGMYVGKLIEINQVEGEYGEYYQFVFTVITKFNPRSIALWNASDYAAMGTKLGDLCCCLLNKDLFSGEVIHLSSLLGLECKLFVEQYRFGSEHTYYRSFVTRVYSLDGLHGTQVKGR